MLTAESWMSNGAAVFFPPNPTRAGPCSCGSRLPEPGRGFDSVLGMQPGLSSNGLTAKRPGNDTLGGRIAGLICCASLRPLREAWVFLMTRSAAVRMPSGQQIGCLDAIA